MKDSLKANDKFLKEAKEAKSQVNLAFFCQLFITLIFFIGSLHQLEQAQTDNEDLSNKLDALKRSSDSLLNEGKREVGSFPTHNHLSNIH